MGAIGPGAEELEDVSRQVSAYYTKKLRRYGPTPLGVDWSCLPTQALRFRKLLQICNFDAPFSLNDVGCGYGALLEYLRLYHPRAEVDYLGVDLSSAMIRSARRLWTGDLVRFHHGRAPPRIANYAIASGIFNVMLEQRLPVWERFIETTLIDLHATSRQGFAVNFVHSPSGNDAAPVGLYCTTPVRWTDFCETHLDCNVSLIDEYGMGEFTLLVRPERKGRTEGIRLARP